jgi:hypothetical protein
MKWAPTAFALATFGLALCSAVAAPIVFFSSPDDLSDIQIGQIVTIRVELSGLPAGDELESLAATVQFDGAKLGAPVAITPGPILPNPLNDPLDFVTASGYGLADGNFLTSGSTSAYRVTGNGVFYTFTLSAQTAGAGQIEFDFVDALQHNSANPGQPIDPGLLADSALPFTVEIPEPTTLALIMMGIFSFALQRRPAPSVRRRCSGYGFTGSGKSFRK